MIVIMEEEIEQKKEEKNITNLGGNRTKDNSNN